MSLQLALHEVAMLCSRSRVWRYEKPSREIDEFGYVGCDEKGFTFLDNFTDEAVHRGAD